MIHKKLYNAATMYDHIFTLSMYVQLNHYLIKIGDVLM